MLQTSENSDGNSDNDNLSVENLNQKIKNDEHDDDDDAMSLIIDDKNDDINDDDDEDDDNEDNEINIRIDKSLIQESKDRTIDQAFQNVDANDADDEDGSKDDNAELIDSLGIVSYSHRIYEQNVVQQIKDKFDKKKKNEIDDYQSNVETTQTESIQSETINENDEVDDNDEDDDDDDDDSKIIDGTINVENYDEYFDDDVDRFFEAPETANIGKGARKVEKVENSRGTKDIDRIRIQDDGDIQIYRQRIEKYGDYYDDDNVELYHIDSNFSIPKSIWERLYKYQQEAVKWMCELHLNLCGGILGDEMGLGKTVQIIAFLIALKYSKSYEIAEKYKYLGPVLLICPATVMFHWVNEFHRWWPPFRVAILHQSGTYKGKSKEHLVNNIIKTNGILITSYKSLVAYRKCLLDKNWHYVILDEGHKIRNPSTKIAHCCNLFQTFHRLILSGTPIQNNLQELWSLMNFVFPNKLGSLEKFMHDFGTPIKNGGYKYATKETIKESYDRSVQLRNIIKPYLLRRTKDEIKNNLKLPEKNEQILFCKLTDVQRELYTKYICSESFMRLNIDNNVALMKKGQFFKALVNIRKICNHPYLFSKECLNTNSDDDFDDQNVYDKSFFRISSKMVVVDGLLKLWHKQKHKVLIFTQSRQMLNILERFVLMKNYTYLRMDGSTTISMREKLIKTFNNNDTDDENGKFIFLLTTRVGGVGVSLTGANRVIIYDPDWNPCTDMQARERCWRIGQKRDVIIYRLMTTGTVEEKIYHRQIFKTYLTQRILDDPKHQKFLKMINFRELFTLSDSNDSKLYFQDSIVKMNRKKNCEKFAELRKKSSSSSSSSVQNTQSLPKIPKLNQSNDPSKEDKDEESKNKSGIDWSSVRIEISEKRRQEMMERVRKICQKRFGNGNNDSNNESKDNSDNSNDSISRPNTSIADSSSTKSSKSEKRKKHKSSTDDIDIEYVIEANDSTKNKKIKILSKKENKNNENKSKFKFEGQKKIDYLVRQESYCDETNAKSNDSKKSNKDDYLMDKIFAGRSSANNYIDCILDHQKIEQTKCPDYSIEKIESDPLIKNVLKELKDWIENNRNNSSTSLPQSSSSTSNDNLFDFIKKRPGIVSSKNNELSSENIIKNNVNSYIKHQSNNENFKYSTKYRDYFEIAKSLLKFFNDNNNYVSTDKIIDEFRPKIKHNQTLIFRSLLRNMAKLKNDEQNNNNNNNNNDDDSNENIKKSNVKYWKLNYEFR